MTTRKALKFSAELVPLILSGEKSATWRLFDDKNLTVGDELALVNAATLEIFAAAKIAHIRIKMIREITEADYVGHEKFPDNDHMLAWYQQNYREPVDWGTPVKMIDFELLPSSSRS